MKTYQKKVIADLTRYLELLNETKSDAAAFRLFWQEKSAPTLGLYQNVIPGVPNLCFKVPTGGGKTFIACNAVRPIFDALPATKTKAVVWLVPSDAILTQTAKALKDTSHPYRQKIDVDFGGRVEVYTKQELLNGQNFNPTAVTEQLSVMVLSYDSFRGRGKEVLKAYQENSNLAEFAKVLGKPDSPIEKADETALFQIINQLNPLVIVDESHHARSELSLEMLENFNPCFVLDLTATPKKESNIISYVDAVQLKNEHMVKLPVIVYNRDSQSEVLIDAIDLRNKLEEIASAEYAKTGKYIRPIALFQAQPKGKEDATTFEKLRDKLVDKGIPAEQIAIRTADVNELKNVELMSLSCPIRYIITVNALKEGWDCPFAYILASLANKTSQVDVEQILGRILRLPHTSQHTQSALNMSYVLTSSNDFNNTVAHIVKGLNSAGFSDKDYRIGESAKPQVPEQPAEQITLPDQQGCPEMEPPLETAEDDFSGLDGKSIGAELERRREQTQMPEITPKADTMLDAAAEVEKAYTDAIQQTDNDPMMDNLPWEVRDKVKSFQVNPQFRENIETLQIPQFFLKVEQSLFTDGSFELLDKEMLAEGFTLKGKAYDIDFAAADDEIREIDVREQDGGLPKVFKMESAEQRYFKEWFNNLPPESRVRQCKEMMFNHRIDTEFYLLRVYQHKLQFSRMLFIKQRSDNGIQSDRLTLTCGTGYQHMRHFTEVYHEHFIGNRLTQGNWQVISRLLELFTADNTLSGNDFRIRVRHFNTNRSFSRNRCNDTNTQCRKAKSDIIFQTANLRDTHALFGSDFIQRHRRPHRCLDRTDFNTKTTQRIYNLVLIGILFRHVNSWLGIIVMLHQVDSRIAIIFQIETRIIRFLFRTFIFVVILCSFYFKSRFYRCRFLMKRRSRIGDRGFNNHRNFFPRRLGRLRFCNTT